LPEVAAAEEKRLLPRLVGVLVERDRRDAGGRGVELDEREIDPVRVGDDPLDGLVDAADGEPRWPPCAPP
jgi:hypothetical protein